MRKGSPAHHGILLIDKEPGWTSHDVVAKVRGIAGQRKVGHTGTLDPAATGLLVLCLGNATRLVEYMTAHDKHYTGTIRLGVTTDTDDSGGQVIARSPVPAITGPELEELATAFTGRIMQVPPQYSAVKVEGRRAYSIARSGDAVALEARPVEIYSLRLEGTEPGLLTLGLHCGPGTYVRSLARDIGERLGCGAHLESLRRTAAGGFSIEEAWSLVAVERLAAEGRFREALLPIDAGIRGIPEVRLDADDANKVLHGVPVPGSGEPLEPIRIYRDDGVFLGIGLVDAEGTLRCNKVLTGPELRS